MSDLNDNVISSVFNYQTDISANLTNFVSWEDKYGPILADTWSNERSLKEKRLVIWLVGARRRDLVC